MLEVEPLTHSLMQIGINTLAPGRFQFHFRKAILKLSLVDYGWGISYKIAFRWMPLDLTDDKSTLVQLMVWCRQATSHYLSQCWPRSLLPYGVTRPQWVKSTKCDKTESNKRRSRLVQRAQDYHSLLLGDPKHWHSFNSLAPGRCDCN